MSLLMPELERQLRAAVRARRAGRAGSTRRRRWPIPGAGGLVVAMAGVSAVVLAVLAVILIGHAGRAPRTARGSQVGAVQPSHIATCVPRRSASATPASATVATGSVDGHSWSLRAEHGGRGLRALEDGSFALDGRSYGVCSTFSGVALELIDATPGGIVYGFIPHPRDYAIRLYVGAGLAASPPPVSRGRGASPTAVRRVLGGAFFVAALPKTACEYSGIVVRAATKYYSYLVFPGRCRTARLVAMIPRPQVPGHANIVPVIPRAGLSAADQRKFLAGRTLVAESGCLACHQIGAAGAHGGPGPNLGDVGNQLRPSAIAGALRHPPAPMPSFRGLSRQFPKRFRALIYFLSELRGGR